MKALILIISVFSIINLSAQPRLEGGQYFELGKPLISPNGVYFCYWQADGNLVTYKKEGQSLVAIWNSETYGKKITSCVFQSDGNLVMYNGTSPQWNSKTNGEINPKNWIQIQDDGNLVIYNSNGKPMWSSFDDNARKAAARNVSGDSNIGFVWSVLLVLVIPF